MKKTKRKVAAFLLAVGMSLTSIPMSAYAQEVQEPSNQEQESQEVVQEEKEEQAESVEEQETVEFQGENPESNQTITSMDLDGNVTEVVIEDGTVDSYAAEKARIGGGQIVNFNTGSGGVTEYVEEGTNTSGYTHGSYGADAAYLGTSGGKVRFMLSGVIGLVDANKVQVVSAAAAQSVSYYAVTGGRLIHYITINVNKSSYASVLDNGAAPSYLSEGTKYYSYDGHYFYPESAFQQMLEDYKNGNRSRSVNASAPYYNYYQYLPFRSTTNYGSDLNAMINARVTASSKMRDLGNSFINAQNTYGINALLAVGVAANESAWGSSWIAQNKNNLFGLNAIDTSPGQSADYFASPTQCVNEFTETFLSKGYMNPQDWRYFGGFLGNKASGVNVKYASDPYWGEKAANVAWSLDKANGNRDAGKYTIGVKDTLSNQHTDLNVRQERSASATKVYSTGTQSSHAFILLEQNPTSGFYKIQSDPVLNGSRSGIHSGSGRYDFTNMYAYVSSDYITKVSIGNGDSGNSNSGNGNSGGNNGGTSVDPVSVPEALKNVISYSAHVQDIGWQDAVSNGVMAGTNGRNLPMEAIKIQTSGVAGLGVKYSTHTRDLGWLEYVSDGSVGGTTGQAKPIEAIKIELTGEKAADYDIYYRVHVQNFGWLDWADNGTAAGSQGYAYHIEAIQIAVLPKWSSAPGKTDTPFQVKSVDLQYRAHVSEIGWQEYVGNGTLAGTVGKNLPVEALQIAVKNAGNLGIKYSAHVRDIGWQDYVKDGQTAGTTGRALSVEALKIQLTGSAAANYDIYYRTHVQNLGWLDWAKNGAASGSAGYAYHVESLQIIIMPKGSAAPGKTANAFQEKGMEIQYQSHVQDIGWQNWVKNGELSGTTGQAKAIEAMHISLVNATAGGNIEYRAHVQDIGWQGWVKNGAQTGTTGRALPMEAVNIRLTGALSEKYDIYYRTHCRDFGWLGWAKNGESAGSEGYAKNIEAIEIKLVKKGEQGPSGGGTAFKKK